MPRLPQPPDVLRAPGGLLDRVRRDVERTALRARNGIKLVAGVDRPDLGQSPRDEIWSNGRLRLWRYRNDDVRLGPPLLIVFSLVSRSYILDLQPGNSFVEHLMRAGFDVFLADYVPADARHADELLEDHADLHLPEAVARTCRAAGSESVNLLGYCFGGVLALLHAARHPESPLRSLTAVATPVDFAAWRSLAELGRRLEVDEILDASGNVPASAVEAIFTLMKPTGELRQYASLLDNVWNDEYVKAHQAMTTWAHDHVAFPGAEARQCVDLLLRENALKEGTLRLAGAPVSLRDIEVPMLTVIAERDHIVPEPVAAPLPGLVGSAQSDVLRLDAGHIGLAVGRTAAKVTIPRIIEFLRQRSGPVAEAA